MQNIVKLEEIEEEALNTISEMSCRSISCSTCPLNYRYANDIQFCLKGLCQHLLENYLNRD